MEGKKIKKVYFGPGPAALPPEVLESIQAAITNFDNTGLSIMEINHMAPVFLSLVEENKARLRDFFCVPDNYSILMLQGGASAQFSAIPLNITQNEDDIGDYIVAGHWSKAAAEEGSSYVRVHNILPEMTNYKTIAEPKTWNTSPNAAYTLYCDNETVGGLEFPSLSSDISTSPIASALAALKAPLMCDMSSNIGSRHFDVSKVLDYGMAFASAQKNMGIPGICVAFVRNDLLNKSRSNIPGILSWNNVVCNRGLHNTPVIISMFVLREMLRWMAGKGGLDYFEGLSRKKSALLYDAIDSSQGYYLNDVVPEYRSRMNVVFRLAGGTEKDREFLQSAEKFGLVNLTGFRTVGHIRASLYNAVTVGDVQKLVKFMGIFESEHC